MTAPIRIAVTGAGGQIGYALIFRIASGGLFGPNQPGSISAGSVPGWYLGFLDGALRIMPGWEFSVAGHPLTLAVLVPGVLVPGAFFTLLAAYPLLDRRLTGDVAVYRPRDAAIRTGIGAAGITFYGLLWAAAANDQIAYHLSISLYAVTWFFRVAVLAGPVLAYMITERMCLGLARRDRDEAEHGRETGRIVMTPEGGYQEIREPVRPVARLLFRGVQEIAAGLLAAPAGFGADPAVRHVGVPLALIAAALADGRAGLQQRPGGTGVVFGQAADDPGGGGTDIGAVQAQPDARDHFGQVLLAQVSVGVGGAGLGAVADRVDGGGQQVSVDGHGNRVGIQHLPGIAHGDSLGRWLKARQNSSQMPVLRASCPRDRKAASLPALWPAARHTPSRARMNRDQPANWRATSAMPRPQAESWPAAR